MGIGSLGVPGVDSSWATGVSGDGSVVIGQSNGNSATTAFMWSSSTGMVEIPPGPDARTIRSPNAISTDGTAIVGSGPTAQSETEAMRRTSNGVVLGLGDFPNAGFHSEALGVSSDGSVVVGHGQSVVSTPNSLEAFVWNQDDGLIGIGGEVVNSRITSLAVDVSDDGRVVIGNTITTRFPGGVWEAFVWDAVNGRRTLQQHLSSHGIDLTNWVLTQAIAISDDGHTVVGWGRNPQGVDQAWIAGIRAVPSVPGL